MAKRIALIGMALLCAALVAGCVVVQPKPDGTFSVSLFPPSSNEVTGSSQSSGSTSSGSSSVRASASSGPAMTGATLISGSWKVQVESTQALKSLPNGARPHGGKQFLVVNVAIQNVGSSGALIVRPNQFQLVDVHGATVTPFHTSLVAFNAQDVRPINVGMGGLTQFVYEVGADSVYGFVVTPVRGADSMTWTVP